MHNAKSNTIESSASSQISRPMTDLWLLVTAPAGRGKSALLVHWMKSLRELGIVAADRWQLAFMPISIRLGTNRPDVFFEGLARRLAEITGETLHLEVNRDAETFK